MDSIAPNYTFPPVGRPGLMSPTDATGNTEDNTGGYCDVSDVGGGCDNNCDLHNEECPTPNPTSSGRSSSSTSDHSSTSTDTTSSETSPTSTSSESSDGSSSSTITSVSSSSTTSLSSDSSNGSSTSSSDHSSSSAFRVGGIPLSIPSRRGASGFSSHPVRYANGEVRITSEDFLNDGFGLSWGHTRSYSNQLTNQRGGLNGNGWSVKEWPRIVSVGSSLCVINGTIYDAVWFELSGTVYVPKFYVQATLVNDTVNHQFIFTDTQGFITRFFSFSDSIPEAKKGQFKNVTDLAGNLISPTYDPTTNCIVSFAQTSGLLSRGFFYTYFSAGINKGMLQYATLEVDGGNASQVAFTYYDDDEPHGNLNDLKSATVQTFVSGTWVSIAVNYYRYYQPGDVDGFAHALKYVVGPLGYAQMVSEGINPEDATNGTIAQHADNFFQYDSASHAAIQEQTQGTRQIFTFERSSSSNSPDYNNWSTKTVETLPDGNQNDVYTNYVGQVLLNVFKSGAEVWCNYFRYDGNGRIILAASPSAVASYDDTSPDFVTLNAALGFIKLYTYYATSGTGAAPGYLQYEQVQEGSSGTPVTIYEYQYASHTVGSVTVYPLWKQICYPSASDPLFSLLCKVFTYDWPGGSLRPSIRTTTFPVVATAQNGSGISNTRQDIYDEFGNLTWLMDERGFITNQTYFLPTGAVTQLIEDVNTSGASGVPYGWVTPLGGGLNLVTDYTVDALGRVTQKLGPVVSIDVGGANTVLRRADWMVYQDGSHEVWTGSGYATGTGPSYTYTLINPVNLTFLDAVGRATDIIQASRSSPSGRLLASDTFPQSAWTRWTNQAYNNNDNLWFQRVYFLIPLSGDGVKGTNYNQSDYGYDNMNRKVRVQTPGLTITRMVYHPMGWVVQKWVGTNDNGATNIDPTGGGAPGNNMVLVESYEYDGDVDKGDGNATQATQYQDSVTARVTNYTYDFRNRLITIDGEIDFYQVNTYDNLDRVTKAQQYNTSASGNLVSQSATNYDNRNRVYQTIRYAVDPSTGLVGNSLVDNIWYDPSGNIIKIISAGSELLEKTVFDGVTRPKTRYKSYNTGETGYPYPISVTGDTVLQQTETIYDAASNIVQQTVRDRFHNATGTGTLQGPSGSNPLARVTFTVFYPDAIGRVINAADYGTYGGAVLSRPSTAPARSSTVLVTTVTYNDRGEAYKTTDPNGTANQSAFDYAGRLTQLLENLTGGSGADQNRETDYTYNADSRVVSMTLINATTGSQVTQYIYGTTLAASNIASNELLATLIYPMSTVSTPDKLALTYNRLGEVKTKTDQLGTIHSLGYDLLGRLVNDQVTITNATVDGTIRRCAYSYEVRGMVMNVTQYNSSNVVVNDIQNVYNTFAQLVTQYQSHSGPVVTSTTPKLQLGYANGSANTVRASSLTYPSGRVVNYNYGSSGGMNDLLSRIAALIDNDGTTHMVDYTYVGMDRIVMASSIQPGTELTYVKLTGESNGDGGDQYTGWDRFSRLIDQRWITNSSGAALERTQYGYDRVGNRLWRDNLVADGISANQDEFYMCDGLYQLKELQRGQLNTGKTGITGTAIWEEDYTFDPTGNWTNYMTKVSGTLSLNQNRTYNKDNALATIASSSALISINVVGNTATVPQVASWSSPFYLAYDAWNRLVTVSTPASSSSSSSASSSSSLSAAIMLPTTLLATYAYDGLSRRTTKVTAGTTRHYFYTPQWQIVEERVGTATTPDRQFLWGLRGPDDLILRDNGTTRLYAMHDYFNCTAIVNTSGVVQERYGYNGFGQVRFMTPTFGPRTISSYTWETLFANYRWDGETGFYQVRYRYLHPNLGRWLTRDPLGNVVGINLYLDASNNATVNLDILGLYQTAGHFYTSYAVAIAKGYSVSQAYAFAYFSQLPDQIDEYSAYAGVAAFGKELATDNTWQREIEQELHSLHGGNVKKRRNCLRRLLGDKSLGLIKRGLLAHAFGDSYAHTYTDPKTGDAAAYRYPQGHGLDGNAPDLPSLRPGLYQQYVADLFNSIPAGQLPQNPGLLNSIVGKNLALSSTPDPYIAQSILNSFIINQSGYANTYRPERGDYQSNPPKGKDDLGPLTRSHVQSVIDLIKKKCCQKK